MQTFLTPCLQWPPSPFTHHHHNNPQTILSGPRYSTLLPPCVSLPANLAWNIIYWTYSGTRTTTPQIATCPFYVILLYPTFSITFPCSCFYSFTSSFLSTFPWSNLAHLSSVSEFPMWNHVPMMSGAGDVFNEHRGRVVGAGVHHRTAVVVEGSGHNTPSSIHSILCIHNCSSSSGLVVVLVSAQALAQPKFNVHYCYEECPCVIWRNLLYLNMCNRVTVRQVYIHPEWLCFWSALQVTVHI